MDDNSRPHRARVINEYLQQEAIHIQKLRVLSS